MQRLIRSWLLLSVLSGYTSTQAAPPDKHHEVQLSPGHALKLWFNPKYGWRARSYDQRYPGCTRQQEHRVYTADGVSLPDLLKNPRNLHWLSDPDEAGQKALYVGYLGLPGGMPPSKRVMGQAKKDLSAIVVQATEQGKIGALRRELAQAEENADFDSVYEQVFGEGPSEEVDLAIFDLTVGEVQNLSNYNELFPVVLLETQGEEQVEGAEDELMVRGEGGVMLSPDDLVQGLYAPVESEEHQAVCRMLRSRKYEVAYSNKVLPLLASLLYKEYVDGKDKEAHGLHVFWRCLLSDPRELVGIHQIALNMRCMEACGADTEGALGKLHKPILDDITPWVLAACNIRFNVCADWHGKIIYAHMVPVPLLPVLEDVWCVCPRVLSYGPLVDGVLGRLRRWKNLANVLEDVALGTLVRLARLVDGAWPLSVKEALLDYVSLGCEHESWKVREMAARACSKGLEGEYSERGWKGIVEALQGLCKDNTSDVRQAAVVSLSKGLESVWSREAWKGIVEALKGLCRDSASDVCQAAVVGLSQALVSVWSREEWRGIIEALKGLCKANGRDVRQSAAVGLSKGLGDAWSGEGCKGIVEALIGLCKDEDWIVRYAAAEALSKGLGNCSEEGWKAILEALKGLCKDEDWIVREAAVISLSRGLERACPKGAWKGIIEALTVLCYDRCYSVRGAAAGGLSRGLERAWSEEVWNAILEVLAGLCKDRNYRVREAASAGLSKGLERAWSEGGWKDIVKALQGLSEDNDCDVRQAAADGLSKALGSKFSGESWRVILEALTRLCKDKHWRVRGAAVLALSKGLEGSCSEELWKAILKVLTGLCKDGDWRVRGAAAWGLSKALESKSKQGWEGIVEALKGLCRDNDCGVRRAAVKGLSQGLEGAYSEGGWQGIVEILQSLCKDNDRDVRWEAASALSKGLESVCSEKAWKGILEVLKSLCRDTYYSVREAAAAGLSKGLERAYSEEDWESILQALKGLCKDDSKCVRHAVVCGLSRGVERSCSQESWQQIIEALIGLWNDDHGSIREAADEALVQAMRQQDLVADVLMDPELLSSALVSLVCTYSPCPILSYQCDPEVAGRIKQGFAQERRNQGWPEALLSVQNLPSVLLPEEDEDMPPVCDGAD